MPNPTPVIKHPMIGRHYEWQTLRTLWQHTQERGAQVVLLCGEAGIGKTRLAEELLVWLMRQGGTTAATRCYAAAGALAHAPIADWLRAETIKEAWRNLDEGWLQELARLLPELLREIPTLATPSAIHEGWQRKRLFDALSHAFLSIKKPTLLIVDDLQWCDRETIEWLEYFLRAYPQVPLLIVGTVRSEEVDASHPLRSFLLNLRVSGQVKELQLAPFSLDETTNLARQLADTVISIEAAKRLQQETEGNPFFVVETLRSPEWRSETYETVQKVQQPLQQLSQNLVTQLPAKVYAVLQRRLAQLSESGRELTTLAAIIGRSFEVDLLLQASNFSEDVVVAGLDELWQRQIVREQGTTAYDFTHDRLRDVAYAEITPLRRRLLHRRVAQALEAQHAANLDSVSGQLASHYDRAEQVDKALEWYRRAAQVSQQMTASHEAIIFLNHALTLLHKLPSDPSRNQQELDIQMALGSAWSTQKSFGCVEAKQAYDRALVLCDQMADTPKLFAVLWGLHEVYLFQSEGEKTLALAERCLQIAEQKQDPIMLMEAHHALWGAHLFFGSLTAAAHHAREGVKLYRPDEHQDLAFAFGAHDTGVCGIGLGGFALFLSGYPEQSAQLVEDEKVLLPMLQYPMSKADCYVGLAEHCQVLGWVDQAKFYAEEAIAIALAKTFPQTLAIGKIVLGWAITQEGNPQQALSLIHEGLTICRESGITYRTAHFFGILAQAHMAANDYAEAFNVLTDAQKRVEQSKEIYFSSELYRLEGECRQQQDAQQGMKSIEVEQCYLRAIQVAQEQSAKSLELRATVSLARLWQRQGKIDSARIALQAIYEWFTEGFDSPDLITAKLLLDTLV